MQTFKLILAGACSLMMIAGGAAAEAPTFTSPGEALKQGLGAFQGGYFEQAIPALEYAKDDEQSEFVALYHLALIYSDNSGPYTNHGKAYEVCQRIVDRYADVDPDDEDRASRVGNSLTMLAGYVRRGLPKIGLKPNLNRAIDYLHYASVMFDNEDAQFELAKLQLTGEGLEENVPNAKHWLSSLTQRGHAGAQAFLADLLWRGKFMTQDKERALALISIAVANAPYDERLWIGDIYQNIYCGAGVGIRERAGNIVAGWGDRYGRTPAERERSDLGRLDADPVRTCANGELVGPLNALDEEPDPAVADIQNGRATPGRPVLYGSSGAGLRDVAAPDAGANDR